VPDYNLYIVKVDKDIIGRYTYFYLNHIVYVSVIQESLSIHPNFHRNIFTPTVMNTSSINSKFQTPLTANSANGNVYYI